jgi:hypothetical protein
MGGRRVKRTRSLRCKDKKDYLNKKAAEDAMHSFRRRNLGGLRTNTQVYKCGDHYHWGHYRNRKR